jgi:hypothetical protein
MMCWKGTALDYLTKRTDCRQEGRPASGKGSIVQKRYSNLSYIYDTFSLSLTLGLAIEKKVRNWEKDTRAKKGSLPEGNPNISTSIISESTTSFVRD